MIRPIDTQIIHPQTPEIAGRQQRTNHLPIEQQSQFGDIMQKEVEEKKDTVIPTQHPEKLKAEKDASKGSKGQDKGNLKKKSNKKSQTTDKGKTQNNATNRIDIRI